jgi:hypothetical protein
MRTQLLAMSVFVFAAACSVEATDGKKGPPSGKEEHQTPSRATPDKEESDGDHVEAGPTDENPSNPEDRPDPSANGTVRDCSSNVKEPTKLRKYSVWPSTRAIKLGAGIDPTKNQPISTIWATGTRSTKKVEGPLALARASGADLSSAARLKVFDIGNGENGITLPRNFTITSKDPVKVWTDALPPSATRLTTSHVEFTQEVAETRLDDVHRSGDAPSSSEHPNFVKKFRPKAFAGFTFSVEVDSDCKMGAIADVLKKKATLDAVLESTDKKLGEVLVMNGATLSVSVLANKSRPEVSTILDKTTCSAADLKACADLVDALEETFATWEGEASHASDYKELMTAGDPFWSVLDYDTAAVPSN